MPRAVRGAAGDAVPEAALRCGSARGCSARGHGTVPIGTRGCRSTLERKGGGEGSPAVLCPGCRMVLGCRTRGHGKVSGRRAQV